MKTAAMIWGLSAWLGRASTAALSGSAAGVGNTTGGETGLTHATAGALPVSTFLSSLFPSLPAREDLSARSGHPSSQQLEPEEGGAGGVGGVHQRAGRPRRCTKGLVDMNCAADGRPWTFLKMENQYCMMPDAEHVLWNGRGAGGWRGGLACSQRWWRQLLCLPPPFLYFSFTPPSPIHHSSGPTPAAAGRLGTEEGISKARP